MDLKDIIAVRWTLNGPSELRGAQAADSGWGPQEVRSAI
jgi:hypothetical protein